MPIGPMTDAHYNTERSAGSSDDDARLVRDRRLSRVTPSELEDIINTFRDKGDDLMRGGIAYLSVPVGSDLIRNGPGTLHALPRCE